MSVLLVCDAPGCLRSIPATYHTNRPASPGEWIICGSSDGRCVVACSSDHFLPATQSAERLSALAARQRKETVR